MISWHENVMVETVNVWFSSVQSFSCVWLFATPWTAACQAFLSITNTWSLLKLMSMSQWCHPTISSSVITFSSRLQSFPTSGSFPMSQFFTSDGQSIGASKYRLSICDHLLSSAAAAAKSLQSCPTLCDPIDGSSPGSPIPGILQARTLEWVAISFSNAWKWKVKVKLLSHVRLLATSWTAAYQAPLSMGFSRQEYWSGVPLPSLYFILDLIKNNYIQGVFLGQSTAPLWTQSYYFWK